MRLQEADTVLKHTGDRGPHPWEDLDGLVLSLARCPGNFVDVARVGMVQFTELCCQREGYEK